MKDPCSSAAKLLEKYFDHEVTTQEGMVVEAHLGNCALCQDALRSMEKLRGLMKIPVEESAREEDFDRVWMKVKREIRFEESRSWRQLLRSWFIPGTLLQKRVWIPAVAAGLMLILIASPLLFKRSPSYPVPTVVEYVESDTNNVMIYESEKGNVTVIWILDEPETETSA